MRASPGPKNDALPVAFLGEKPRRDDPTRHEASRAVVHRTREEVGARVARRGAPGAAAHLAAEASARRSRRRLERRVFVSWRGLAEGLTAHELALSYSGNAMLAVGSPRRGWRLWRRWRGPGVGTRRRAAAAVAAAIAAAGRAENSTWTIF